ncbi:MAG: PEP-utilizing enzyme [bacterium]
MNTLKGISIGSGKITGEVKLILSKKDFIKFKPNMILVTEDTDPDWTPLIIIAKGVVTDLGGRLCHAAIIAREFGKIAIIGTEKATKILKNGDLVEIDADNGTVMVLSR